MCKVIFELKPYPELRDVPKPILPIIFKSPIDETKTFETTALIDSGADICTLPLEAQSVLGLNMVKLGAEKTKMGCACGRKDFYGYRYKLKVVVYDYKNRPIERLVWVLFGGPSTMPLIGRNLMDIFEKINYDNVEKKGYFLGLREEEL